MTTVRLSIRFLLLFLILSIGQLAAVANAQTREVLQEEIHTLAQSVDETQQLSISTQEKLAALQAYHKAQLLTINPENSARLLQQAQQSINIANADISSLRLMIAVEQQITRNLMDDIHRFETSTTNTSQTPDTELIDLKYEKLTLQKKRNALLEESLSLTRSIVKEQTAWQEKLQGLQALQVESSQQIKRNKEIISLQNQLGAIQKNLSEWQSMLLGAADTSPLERTWLERQILQAEEKRQRYFTELAIVQLEPLIDTLQTFLMQVNSGLFALRKANEQASFLLKELEYSKKLVNEKVQLLQQQLLNTEENFKQQQITYNDFIQQKNTTTALMVSYRTTIAQTYGVGLTAHQPLPANLEQWRILYEELATMPSLLMQKIKQDWSRVLINLSQANSAVLALLTLIELAWLLICFAIWHAFNKNRSPSETSQKTFSANLWLTFTQMLAHTRLGLIFFYIVIGLVLLTTFSGEMLNIMVYLTLVWIIFKITIGIARLTLIERPENAATERDIKLFNTLRWSFIASAWLAAITLIAHQLTLSPEVTGFVDRLFMLILCFICYPLLRIRDVFPALLAPYIATHNYLKRTIQVIAVLAPLTILSSAAIGLLGYVNLAWQIASIEGKLIVVVSLWLLLRGVLRDVMQWLSEFCIAELKNGWLWTEAFLKPLQHVLHIVLLAAMAFFLSSWITNGREPSPILQKAQHAIYYPLFMVGDAAITTVSLIHFFLVLMVVIWAGKWSREFAYRWLFTRFQDPGVRNSLSVFTQYGVLTIGGLIVLKVLGIDLTTFAVVAGALAVSVGFGVRDIANNLLCGLLLLIERPVRQGDVIKVGEFEGKVIDIGMRAITIKNGDNVEVLIPNAALINQTVINTTRSEEALRSSITLKVAFHQEPTLVQKIIQEIIVKHPAVVTKPAIQVTLKEVGDCAIVLNIHYHTFTEFQDKRDAVKSELLIQILAGLKAANIDLPYPQHEIRLQNFPSSI